MIFSMATVRPPDSAPITLEYQRLQSRRRRAVGGLLMFSGFLCLVALLVTGVTATDALQHLPHDPLLMAATTLPVIIAGIYLSMAILFYRHVKWAGWVALAISALIMAGFLCLSFFYLFNQMTETRYDPVWLLVLVDFLLLLIALGPTVVCIEVFWALRTPDLWVEPTS